MQLSSCAVFNCCPASRPCSLLRYLLGVFHVLGEFTCLFRDRFGVDPKFLEQVEDVAPQKEGGRQQRESCLSLRDASETSQLIAYRRLETFLLDVFRWIMCVKVMLLCFECCFTHDEPFALWVANTFDTLRHTRVFYDMPCSRKHNTADSMVRPGLSWPACALPWLWFVHAH